MAHYEKFSKQGIGHVFLHCRRAYEIDGDGNIRFVNFGNKEITAERTHLNYNLNINEDGRPANQQKQYERILQGKTIPEGKELVINKRKDLKVACSWLVTIPADVREGDDRKFFEAVYNHLHQKYPHCISAYCHYDECQNGCENNLTGLRAHMHYLFCPIYYDSKKDVYKISANELIDRNALKTFHDELSKAVEAALGYKVSIMTGEFSDRENGIRESIDILKYKAQKMAQEYEAVKCKFKDSGLKLSADMANYIIHTGQKDAFIKYQRQIESIEHQRGR